MQPAQGSNKPDDFRPGQTEHKYRWQPTKVDKIQVIHWENHYFLHDSFWPSELEFGHMEPTKTNEDVLNRSICGVSKGLNGEADALLIPKPHDAGLLELLECPLWRYTKN